MTPEQRWQFDVDGMIVVPNALDPQQVAQMNAAMDARSAAGLEVGGSTNRVQDSHRDNPLHFSPAFRRALDNPRIAPILEELIGSGGVAGGGFYDAAEQELPTYRIDHVNLNHIDRTPGSGLHNTGDGSSHAGGSQFFQAQDRRFFNGLLVVAYELRDTIDNDGGFGCVPGTHKANSPMPSQWQDLSGGGVGPPNLRRVPARAVMSRILQMLSPAHTFPMFHHSMYERTSVSLRTGNLVCALADWLTAQLSAHAFEPDQGDAIIFTEVLTHVTLPWSGQSGPRRVIFYKFSPHGVAYSGNYLSAGEFEHYNDVTPRILSLLEAPNARYPGRPKDFRYELAATDQGRKTTAQSGRRQVARL